MSTGPEAPGSGPTPDADVDVDVAAESASPDAAEGEAPEDDEDDEFDEYGPPFVARSFGGELVWADADGYTCKILRVRAGENVVVSTQGRRDMTAMLTAGRGVLEVRDGDSTDRVELLPASPVAILPGQEYRLIALTEVELHTVYSPA